MSEISQIAMRAPTWNVALMAKLTTGISARIVDMLEAVRPSDGGVPMSDNRWCDLARVNLGFLRDLRKGVRPNIDYVEQMVRVAGLSLSDFFDGATPPISAVPEEDELAAMIQGAQNELQPGTTIGDYPSFVAAALRARLLRYAADARTVAFPDGVAQSPPATKRSARAG